jgi:hypothetical protein
MLVFTDAEKQKLNLYWHVVQESRGPNADESFWKAAIATEVAGVLTKALVPTDQLFQVCIDRRSLLGAASITWISDAMMILRASSSAINWQRLVTHAQERLLVLPLREALTYLHDVFAAPIPAPIMHKLYSKSASRMERWEAGYLSSSYRHLPFGDVPFFWFDYLRSRELLANESQLSGFLRYLHRHAESSNLWTLLLFLLLACWRRIQRIFSCRQWRSGRVNRLH